MFAGGEVLSARLRECAVAVCWRQWHSLAAIHLVAGRPSGRSIVDPEALILLTLSVRRLERRVDDQLRWWAEEGSSLLSVQRMRSLLKLYPTSLRHGVAAFAAMATDHGDMRWATLAGGASDAAIGRPEKRPRELQLLEPSTLMLRLRAGFGVGAKADALTFLIGISSLLGERAVWASAATIAEGVSYSVASIRRALSDMSLARLVETSLDRPARHSVSVDDWVRLFRLDEAPGVNRIAEGGPVVPAWRFWAQMYAFLTSGLEFSEGLGADDASAVVQASRARDLFERHRRVLAWNGIEPIDPRLFPGERFLDAFEQIVARACDWIEREA